MQGGGRRVSFVGKLCWDQTQKETLEAIWLEVMSLLLQKLGGPSGLETRQKVVQIWPETELLESQPYSGPWYAGSICLSEWIMQQIADKTTAPI